MKRAQANLSEEIKLACKGFYRALQAILEGDVLPMEKVWSHAEDVTYLGPQGGILVGWKEVSNAWKHQASQLKGRLEQGQVFICCDGNIGIVQNYEIGETYVNGKVENVRIRATNIFRKEEGNWKMITHQTDPLPFLQ